MDGKHMGRLDRSRPAIVGPTRALTTIAVVAALVAIAWPIPLSPHRAIAGSIATVNESAPPAEGQVSAERVVVTVSGPTDARFGDVVTYRVAYESALERRGVLEIFW